MGIIASSSLVTWQVPRPITLAPPVSKAGSSTAALAEPGFFGCDSGLGTEQRARLALGGGRRLHSGQDADHLGSLRGRDVLGHVYDRIHGNLWIGLNKAANKAKKETSKLDEASRTPRLSEERVQGNEGQNPPNDHLRICLRM